MPRNTSNLHGILGIAGRPAYVKLAQDTDETKIPGSAFADPMSRLYGIYSKEATYCSALLAHQEDPGEEVKAKLAAAAHLWGIEPDLQAAFEKLASAHRHAGPDELADTDYALVADHGGKRVRKFAAVDPETTFEAAIAFHENRHRYPFSWRKQAATNLLDKASTHGVVLPAYVQTYLLKAAGLAIPTTESLDEAMVQRLNRSAPKDREAAEKLASVLDCLVNDEPLRGNFEFVSKVLETVDEYDRETKIAAFYGHGLDLPEEILGLNETQLRKIAADNGRLVTLTNGHEVDIHLISPEILDAVQDGMGKMGHAKLAEVLPTLPKPDADLLVELLPRRKTAGDGDVKPSAPSVTPTAPSVAPAPAVPASATPTAQPSAPAAPAAPMDPNAAYEAKIFGAPAPAAAPKPQLGNSLTDDNFSQQAQAAKEAPMPAAPVSAPTAGIPISAPEHHFSQSQQLANNGQQADAIRQGLGNNAGSR